MAQTVGTFSGNSFFLELDGVAVAHSIDATMSFSQDTYDATTKDSSKWNEHKRGNRGFEISGSGLLAFDASMGAIQLIDAILAAANVTFKLSNDVGDSSNSGDIEYRGSVSPTATSFSVPQAGMAAFDFSMLGNGAPTKVTIT